MVVRHIVFAGLFATASLANAGLVEPAASAPKAAWSFNAGPSQAGPSDALGTVMAAPGTWNAHSRMGDRAPSSTMLLSQRTSGPAPAADAAAIVNAGSGINAGTGSNAAVDAVVAADIPEPATGALMLAGLLGAGALSRRRRK